jgi:transcriptional regulator with XRE-family HTH domain
LLTAARKAAGLTQRELAKRIGRPHSVIARALDLGDAEMMACAGAAIGGDLEL